MHKKSKLSRYLRQPCIQQEKLDIDIDDQISVSTSLLKKKNLHKERIDENSIYISSYSICLPEKLQIIVDVHQELNGTSICTPCISYRGRVLSECELQENKEIVDIHKTLNIESQDKPQAISINKNEYRNSLDEKNRISDIYREINKEFGYNPYISTTSNGLSAYGSISLCNRELQASCHCVSKNFISEELINEIEPVCYTHIDDERLYFNESVKNKKKSQKNDNELNLHNNFKYRSYGGKQAYTFVLARLFVIFLILIVATVITLIILYASNQGAFLKVL
ncbi:uncharacterized protein NEPG_01671 [Nematocida parisii ERTm1]|uniref:uncharacterized protein n=1 Tax=Nematocida parisii (strain ERTm1 / ATCC PRA-289) TaxID=881290 RepID=UPI000264B629|nr:uncharacterized protein NEPG_01671 [Nematocida parisii ERTm1]EIJ93329.1 hypothetical protein NEPG_01671 [Nematocida parisii ERTm1]|eukprot:XP_013059499.1 hypothetical protein NEPG_01671 [Nematocida parisii ERTm1]